MLDPALLETVGTIVLVLLLFLAAALSILALPWSEADLRKVHAAAESLVLPRRVAMRSVRRARLA